MWLIDTSSLKLKSFTPPASEPYAILSHTWSREQEVTFQEFREPREPTDAVCKKLGFRKIKETCRLAKDIGIKYAWVDTCCINKESSAELSEAINSMYDWYRQSTVCYVYLGDWSAGSTQWENLETNTTIKWFKRGWTLQELIAPRNVQFYDEGWGPLKCKTDQEVISALERVTGIGADVLRDGSEKALRGVPVGKRISWASQRETDRPEDMAYCLLGIFQINMPMLYGEGSKRAFIRLQEEIIRVSADLSLFGWQAAREDKAAFRGILAHHPREFAKLDKCTILYPQLGQFGGGNQMLLAENPPGQEYQHVGEYMMTNNGLRINFSAARRGAFVLRLNHKLNRDSHEFGIVLRKFDAFVLRIDPSKLCKCEQNDISVIARGKPVYLARDIDGETSREIENNYQDLGKSNLDSRHM